MLFQSFEFIVFFLLLLLLLFIFRNHNSRKLILLIASYIFYGWWNPYFILLMLLSSTIDFWAGKKLAIELSERKRKNILLFSIVANLSLLAFFKYANFFQHNMFLFIKMLGYQPSWTAVNILLPIGISFYTFQTLSYTIDVYHRKIPTCRSPLDFFLFVSFFPQLIAGPIVRAGDFIPQLQKPAAFCFDKIALFTFLRGLIKKVIVADNISLFSDVVFRSPENYSTPIIWLGAISFSIQVYCDFSGYSDMAIGLARSLGYQLPLNFNRPLFSTNPSEFWNRWHITLSSWFKDYLYFPLGGSKKGNLIKYRNIGIVFIISGIWHGAGWNFIFFGLVNGLAVIVHKIWEDYPLFNRENFSRIQKKIWNVFSFALLQLYWVYALTFFRIDEISKMKIFAKKMWLLDADFRFTKQGISEVFPLGFLLFVFFYLLHAYSFFKEDLTIKFSSMNLYKVMTISFFIGILLLYFWPTGEKAFIYFQF